MGLWVSAYLKTPADMDRVEGFVVESDEIEVDCHLPSCLRAVAGRYG